MKRTLALLGLAVAVAVASYFFTRLLLPSRAEDPAAWLRREFALSDTQAAAVEKLQADYQPVCMEHCRLIREAHERLAAHPGDRVMEAEVTRLENICTQATLAHLREVAAQMSPMAGARFLALVEPRVARHDHQGPLGLK